MIGPSLHFMTMGVAGSRVRTQALYTDLLNIYNLAIFVRYKGSANERPTSKITASNSSTLLNPLNQVEDDNVLFVTRLRTVQMEDKRLKATPDETYFFGFDFKKVSWCMLLNSCMFIIENCTCATSNYTVNACKLQCIIRGKEKNVGMHRWFTTCRLTIQHTMIPIYTRLRLSRETITFTHRKSTILRFYLLHTHLWRKPTMKRIPNADQRLN